MKAGFGVHVAVESGLLIVVVSGAGTLRMVSGGVGDLHQAPAVQEKARPSAVGREPPGPVELVAEEGRDRFG